MALGSSETSGTSQALSSKVKGLGALVPRPGDGVSGGGAGRELFFVAHLTTHMGKHYPWVCLCLFIFLSRSLPVSQTLFLTYLPHLLPSLAL